MTIAIPSHLSDGALIAEVTRCARDERHATAQLVAHLAEPIEAHSRRKMAVVRRQAKARPVGSGARPAVENSRHVTAEVKHGVGVRDAGRCALIGASGHRCSERGFLEYHHVVPYAVGGKATIANIQLRCRAHNGYGRTCSSEPIAGKRGAGGLGERPENYAVSWGFSPVPERAALRSTCDGETR